MEQLLFLEMQYAILAVLYEKKQLSERDFQLLIAPLREKMRKKNDEIR